MEKIAVMCLWCFVLAAGVLTGGAVYELVVTQPLWAGVPPMSVQEWTLGTIQKPFFEAMTPLWTLLGVASFGLSFVMPPAARPYARAIGGVCVVVMVATLAFFVPILMKTQATGGAGLSAEEITRLTQRFVHWNVLRVVLLAGTWLAGIRALIIASR